MATVKVKATESQAISSSGSSSGISTRERIVSGSGDVYYTTSENTSSPTPSLVSGTITNQSQSCADCLNQLGVENIGNGIPVYVGKGANSYLQFKSFIGSNGISITSTDNEITFSLDTSSIGYLTNIVNKGSTGVEIFDTIENNTAYLRKLVGGTHISLTQNDDYITIDTNFSSDFGVTNATNIGTTGISIYDSKISNVLNFRSISANSNKINVLLGSNEHSVKLDVIEANLTLANLSGFLPASKISGLSTVAISGSYTDLLNKPSIPTNLADLNDVNINSLINDEILTYDSASNKWIPKLLGSGNNFGNYIVNSSKISANITNDTLYITSDSNIILNTNVSSKSINFSLSTTGVTSGTYTNPTITIDKHGRILSASSNSNGLIDPTTDIGDIIYRNSSNVIARLGIGSNNQILTAYNGLPSWKDPLVKSVNGLTGTVLLGLENLSNVNISNVNNGQVLAYNSTTSKWTNQSVGAVSSVGIINGGGINVTDSPITTSGNITIGLSTTGVISGAYSYPTVTVDSYGRITSISSNNAISDPTTSKGDLIYRNSSNIISRLSIGLSGQVLTVNSSGIPYWANPTSAGVTSINGLIGKVSFEMSNLSDVRISSLSSGQILKYNGSKWINTTASTGTVSSIGITGQNGISVSNSPITTSGNITVGLSATGVTAGSYTNSNITVDAYGRITSISNGSSSGGKSALIISTKPKDDISETSTIDTNALIGAYKSSITTPINNGQNGILFSSHAKLISSYGSSIISCFGTSNTFSSMTNSGYCSIVASDNTNKISYSTYSSIMGTFASTINSAQYSSIISSYRSLITGSGNDYNAVISSFNTENNVPYSVAMGYGRSSSKTANRKIHLYSKTGNIQISGTLTSSYTFTDYAEYFPNLTGIEIPLGTLVMLNGYGVIPSTGDDILGVISATAGIVLGDTPFTWSGRYKSGDHGERLYDSSGDLIENANYDQNMTNIPRSDRPDEWSLVGLLGQVYINIDSTVTSSNLWLKSNNGIGTKSDSKTNVRVMKITKPYDEKIGYGIAFCMLK